MIHDWGSFLGYQFMHLYPSLMTRVVSFDIGSGEQTTCLAEPFHAAATKPASITQILFCIKQLCSFNLRGFSHTVSQVGTRM